MIKKKITSLLLITTIIGTSLFSIPEKNVLANEIKNSKVVETNTGALFEYSIIENGQTIYYKEEIKNNVVYTKKYIK